MTLNTQKQIQALEQDWAHNPRWKGVTRPYSAEEVVCLRGHLQVEYTRARRGAQGLWQQLKDTQSSGRGYINCKSSFTTDQALQQARDGIQTLYLTFPALVRQLNNSFKRADANQWKASYMNPDRQEEAIDYFLPLVADAEAGFNQAFDPYELMKSLITNGAAAVRFGDSQARIEQGSQVSTHDLLTTEAAIQKLVSARLAADVLGVPSILLAGSAADKSLAIERALVYAPYVDLLWYEETTTPDLTAAQEFAQAIHAHYPEQLLAYRATLPLNGKQSGSSDCTPLHKRLALSGYQLQLFEEASCSEPLQRLLGSLKQKGRPQAAF